MNGARRAWQRSRQRRRHRRLARLLGPAAMRDLREVAKRVSVYRGHPASYRPDLCVVAANIIEGVVEGARDTVRKQRDPTPPGVIEA